MLNKKPDPASALRNLSARTVEDHEYRMMETLGIESSAELIHSITYGLVQ